jgi:hypothetical protein
MNETLDLNLESPELEGAQEPNVRPDLKTFEQHFLTMQHVYDEVHVPVRDRWTAILQEVPAMRGHSLCEDLTPIYKEAWENATGARLMATFNLCLLQARFNYILWFNNYTQRAYHDLYRESLLMWQRKLYERVQAWPKPRKTPRKRKMKIPVWIN